MARVTRSKKIEVAEDHTAIARQTPLPDTPAKQTEPLVEIHGSSGMNKVSMAEDPIASEVKGLKAAYKAAIGITKKSQRAKSKKGKQHTTQLEDTADDTPTEGGDSPVPEATRLLLQSREGSLRSLLENAVLQSNLIQTAEHPPVIQEEVVEQNISAPRVTRRQLAQAQAASEAVANQKPNAQDTRNENELEAAVLAVEDEVGAEAESATESPDFDTQSATVNRIASSPTKSPIKTLAEVERDYGREDSAPPAYDAGEDSFVQQITARSPAKPVSRIEDSVEALDKLEEALDALKEAALAESVVSPEKKRQQRPILPNETAMKQTEVQTQIAATIQPPRSGAATMRVKPTAPRPSVLKKATSMTFKPSPTELSRASSVQVKTHAKPKAPVKRPLSLMPPKEPAKSTKPPTRPTFELPGEAVARRLKEQREARLAQRESSEDSFHTARAVSGPRIKSMKPPTYPAFELPGEALSRKKKEAHEARLKAQEEEERKRREFKARPIRNSMAPDFVPRETVASRMRQSKIGLENMGVEDIAVPKRGSNVGAHRPSILELNKANISAPRAKAAAPPVRKATPTTHGPSMSGRAMQRTVSTTDVQIQRQRAKDIYNRDAKMAEDMERERREREAAAKHAREVAAERGRQASREWAERQQAKKLVDGDKGMSAGYGPGGQMGLRS